MYICVHGQGRGGWYTVRYRKPQPGKVCWCYLHVSWIEYAHMYWGATGNKQVR